MGSLLYSHGPQCTTVFPREVFFTRLWECLVTTLGGCARQIKSSATSSGIDAEVSQISDLQDKLSKNSRQWQNKINKCEAQISSLPNQNTQLKGLLDPTLLVNAISQAVTASLKINSQSIFTSRGGAGTTGTRYISKPYFGQPQPSQLVPGADGWIQTWSVGTVRIPARWKRTA